MKQTQTVTTVPDSPGDRTITSSSLVLCEFATIAIRNVKLTPENTKMVTMGIMPKQIPRGFSLEPPILYSENSSRKTNEVNQSPSTFIARLQNEMTGGNNKTSSKRYFANTFTENHTEINWHVHCKRWFSFEYEHIHQQSSRSGSEGSKKSLHDAESKPGSDYGGFGEFFLNSDTEDSTPPPSPREASRLTLADVVTADRRVPSDASDIAQQGETEEDMLSCTRLLRFNGTHHRIYINIFLIFHHWVRHDYFKPGADKALWDPFLYNTGFDALYPPTKEETHLRPWMFTVTQVLRDWVCQIVTNILDIFNGEINPATNQHIKQNLNSGILQLSGMFETDYFNVRDNITHERKHLDPIIAALDWETPMYEILVERAKEILIHATKQAFPYTHIDFLPGPIGAANIEEPTTISDYVLNNLQSMKKYYEKKGQSEPQQAYSHHRNKIIVMIGQFVTKTDPNWEFLSQQPHIPILVPSLLRKGDILGIYSKEGCTIVEFTVFKDAGPITQHEQMQNIADGNAGEVLRQREWNNFQMKHRHVCYKLDKDDDPEVNYAENYINVYLLAPE